MALAARGDTRAFRRIVDAHQPAVLAYCVRFLGDAALARDVAQDVFMTLWQERAAYTERGKLRFYLLKVARLRCLAAAKKRTSQAGLADALETRGDRGDVAPGGGDGASPGGAVEARQQAQALHRAIARLKPAHADLIILRYLEELSIDDIRAVTGLRPGTIKSRLSRAVTALRRELERDEARASQRPGGTS